MTVVNTHEAKTQLSRLLKRVAAGEEIVIARAGQPLARLVPCEPHLEERVAGSARGLFRVPDDFDAPLSDELLELFEG